MKKLFFYALVMNLFVVYSALGIEGDYCISRNGYCYWCNTQGPSSSGYCDRGYAGCTNTDQIVISSGGTTTDQSGYTRKCSSSGWCYSSCSWKTPSYRYTDIGDGYSQIESNNNGCFCNEWARTYVDGSAYVCSDGYYGTSNASGYSGCTRCPSYQNAAGETFYGESMAGMNKLITSCWLDGENGPFSDDTGVYEISTDKCMYNNTTLIPGGGVVVGPGTISPSEFN